MRGATSKHYACRPSELLFQSTLPVRGATLRRNISYENLTNFNPRSPCGERHQLVQIYVGFHQNFNPRSPCGERLVYRQATTRPNHFNPRSPCGERRRIRTQSTSTSAYFNPRSPCGERPSTKPKRARLTRHFNPRSPCGERPIDELVGHEVKRISIHAPRAGSDPALIFGQSFQRIFQSTLPVRGATSWRWWSL